MVYYKMILDDRRSKSDGIYPVIIRIIHNRKNSSIATGIRVHKDYWDTQLCQIKPNHPNYSSLNPSLLELYIKVQRAIHSLDEDGIFSFSELKDRLNPKSKPSKIISGATTFNEFSEQLINNLLSINKVGNALVYQTASNRLISFSKSSKLKFKEIDYTFLEAFQRQLIMEGVKQNTISNYLRTIRAIYNRGIKARIIDRSFYPFVDVPIKSERTAKRAILVSDLSKIYNLDLKENSREWNARNFFFLSFSLIGISFTDLAYLTSSNIVKGRMVYRRRKTRKEYSIKISPLAQRIIKDYCKSNPKYLLPVLSGSIVEDSLIANKTIHQWIKTTNKWMKKLAERCGISETLTTYVARHTWATTAKRLGYSNELIAEAMGHEYGNKITNIYLDSFDQSVIDELNAKVIATLENKDPA